MKTPSINIQVPPRADQPDDSDPDSRSQFITAIPEGVEVLRAHRMLIVDGDAEFAATVKELGAKLGCEVVVAADFEAFEKTQAAFRPDVIVLDLMVPGKDGIQILRYLSAAGSRAQILLVSSFDRKVLEAAERLGKSHDLNIEFSLKKPIAIPTLHSALRRVIDVRAEVSGQELREAVKQGQFLPFFQPKVDLVGSENGIIGVETLARWDHPYYGQLSPLDFIEPAERVGIMEDLTTSMLEQALIHATECRSEGLNLPFSLNVSATSLTNLSLPDNLAGIAARYGFDSSMITLELTETSTTEDKPETLDILTRLRLQGFKLSMDDFGTGYSSLLQLVRLPFNEVKIDQQFVRGIGEQRESDIVVRSTVALAHGLGMTVCAEGVENKEILDFLIDIGCDAAQGTLIQQPMPGDELVPFIRRWRERILTGAQIHEFAQHRRMSSPDRRHV